MMKIRARCDTCEAPVRWVSALDAIVQGVPVVRLSREMQEAGFGVPSGFWLCTASDCDAYGVVAGGVPA